MAIPLLPTCDLAETRTFYKRLGFETGNWSFRNRSRREETLISLRSEPRYPGGCRLLNETEGKSSKAEFAPPGSRTLRYGGRRARLRVAFFPPPRNFLQQPT